MAYSKTSDTLAKYWFDQIVESPKGTKLMFPSDPKGDKSKDGYVTKDEAASMKFKMYNERKIHEENINALEAQSIRISLRYIEGKFFIHLEKHGSPPVSGYKILPDGSKSRVSMIVSERERTISKMKEDGFSIKEIEELMGELSKEEKMEEKEKCNECGSINPTDTCEGCGAICCSNCITYASDNTAWCQTCNDTGDMDEYEDELDSKEEEDD
ncbi:MAG TPA: hypothetical protein ENI76_06340 [Ignavibacteria bacterium]|mgnify:CR=1 FL=1|nr:hypothetical protein [Ignavibacteria bacterium]